MKEENKNNTISHLIGLKARGNWPRRAESYPQQGDSRNAGYPTSRTEARTTTGQPGGGLSAGNRGNLANGILASTSGSPLNRKKQNSAPNQRYNWLRQAGNYAQPAARRNAGSPNQRAKDKKGIEYYASGDEKNSMDFENAFNFWKR